MEKRTIQMDDNIHYTNKKIKYFLLHSKAIKYHAFIAMNEVGESQDTNRS